MIVGGNWRRMGDVDVTVDPIVLTRGTQTATAPAGGAISGDVPPLVPAAWWPWILLAAVGAAVWWLSSDSEEGRGAAGPLLG